MLLKNELMANNLGNKWPHVELRCSDMSLYCNRFLLTLWSPSLRFAFGIRKLRVKGVFRHLLSTHEETCVVQLPDFAADEVTR